MRSLERQAQSYVALGSETVHMLQYLTAEVVEPFMVTEVVDRLAAMLDYNLAQLVGPKCTELKVLNEVAVAAAYCAMRLTMDDFR